MKKCTARRAPHALEAKEIGERKEELQLDENMKIMQHEPTILKCVKRILCAEISIYLGHRYWVFLYFTTYLDHKLQYSS